MPVDDPTPTAPPRSFAPDERGAGRPLSAESIDALEGHFPPKPGDTPAGYISLERHYRIIEHMMRTQAEEMGRLKQEVSTLRDELAKVKRSRSALAVLLDDDEVRNAIAGTITWLGRSLAAAILVSALAVAGYEFVYGDYAIGRATTINMDAAAESPLGGSLELDVDAGVVVDETGPEPSPDP